MAERVGFIGLGTMGLPMVTNLARKGAQVTVFDVNPQALAAAQALPGVQVAGGPGEVAAWVRVLFTCLPSDAIVRAIYLDPQGIGARGGPGLVTCDCSTVSPQVTEEIHRSLKPRGITHMDTPMLGSQPQAVEGQIFFIVGGEQAQVPRIAPYLAMMGKQHLFVGGPATGNRIKLLHNGLAATIAVAVAESLGLCIKLGVDPAIYDEVVRNGGGMAYGTYFERRVRRMLAGEFAPTFMLELMRKDAGLALAMAQGVEVTAPMLEQTLRTYDEAQAAGWGKEDFSAVTHVWERRVGRTLSSGGT